MSHNKDIWLTEVLIIEIVVSYMPPKMHWSGDVPEAVVRFIQCLVWWKCIETKGCFELCQKANIGWTFIAVNLFTLLNLLTVESYVLFFSFVFCIYIHTSSSLYLPCWIHIEVGHIGLCMFYVFLYEIGKCFMPIEVNIFRNKYF